MASRWSLDSALSTRLERTHTHTHTMHTHVQAHTHIQTHTQKQTEVFGQTTVLQCPLFTEHARKLLPPDFDHRQTARGPSAET